MSADWRRSDVTAGDGVRLAVHACGADTGPVVLLLHGYPDDHTVWNPVAELLGQYRLLALDVRGAGASQVPDRRSSYRLDQLAADIDAVAATTGGPVHLVAHDWGSVQAWHAVTRSAAPSRYRSITSISGPSAEFSASWYRRTWRTDKRAVLRQARASWYIPVFLLPRLPELLWRAGVAGRLLGKSAAPRSIDDAIHGLELYRANARHAGRARRCEVPALVIAPRSDPFVTPAYALGAPAGWAAGLRSTTVAGGHWVMVEDPGSVAGPVAEFIDDVEADVDAGRTWNTGPRA